MTSGSIARHGAGWRAQIYEDKRWIKAPTRQDRLAAFSDLDMLRDPALRLLLCGWRPRGGVHRKGNGWRAKMRVRGRYFQSPIRGDRHSATVDLLRMRDRFGHVVRAPELPDQSRDDSGMAT